VKRTAACLYWPADVRLLCGVCGKHRSVHDNKVSSELWLIADFLHCFEDLETVYLIFNDVKQGPFDRVRDHRYTVSGIPDAKGGRAKKERWDNSPATVFRGDGGSVRELR